MSRQPHIVIAAGGTGGHMFPAQALAEAMLAKGWRVTLSTDARGARYTGGFPPDVTIRRVPSATFARGGIAAKAMVPLRLIAGIAAATLSFMMDRPSVVAGFGGYPSIPALSAAWLLRIPRMLHEQNGVLGRVNEIFARRVDRVACGTWPTTLPSGVEGVHCGNPVRRAILDHANAPVPLDSNGRHILVMGGSQGARILSEIVPEAISRLPAPLVSEIHVSHQARPEDTDSVSERYRQSGIPADIRSFYDDVPERLVQSALVVSRAGASTIAEISVVGRPAILIPYAAAAGDHQTANARSMAEAGGALIIQESELDPASLSEQITDILTLPGKAESMRSGAFKNAVPNATERLVEIVTELSPMRPT